MSSRDISIANSDVQSVESEAESESESESKSTDSFQTSHLDDSKLESKLKKIFSIIDSNTESFIYKEVTITRKTLSQQQNPASQILNIPAFLFPLTIQMAPTKT